MKSPLSGDAAILATCGGNAVCVTAVTSTSGEVIHKFVHDGDDFSTIAWTKLPLQNQSAYVPVLLAGGVL